MDLRPFKKIVRRHWVARGISIALLFFIWLDVVADNSWEFLLDYSLLCYWLEVIAVDASYYRIAKWVLLSDSVDKDLAGGGLP